MKYPIGIQIFSQIRENGNVYVDKTDFKMCIRDRCKRGYLVSWRFQDPL